MKLKCYGKYGPYPKGGESCSCYMLSHNDKNIIIDLGSGALSKVLIDMRAEDIDALVLSHLHADHMADVLTLRYALGAAKKMGKRQDPLPVYLPAQPQAESGLISGDSMIDAKFITDGCVYDIFGIEVRFALMPHPVPSYAMAFAADGKKFVYSGDTQDNESLAGFARDADLFLMEAALLSMHKTQGAVHVSAKDAGRIGKDARARRLLITHIFPEYDENDILNEVREQFPDAKLIEEQKTYEV